MEKRMVDVEMSLAAESAASARIVQERTDTEQTSISVRRSETQRKPHSRTRGRSGGVHTSMKMCVLQLIPYSPASRLCGRRAKQDETKENHRKSVKNRRMVRCLSGSSALSDRHRNTSIFFRWKHRKNINTTTDGKSRKFPLDPTRRSDTLTTTPHANTGW